MTDREQTDHFANELDKLVDRFRVEYDMSYAVIVGTLEIKASNLCAEGRENQEGE